MNGINLTDKEALRYSRHLILPEINIEGQKKLKKARVLIIGAGGLGSPLSLYLASSGIGKIGIVDFDNVDISNLQRQIIHNNSDIGFSKALSAKNKMENLNPFIEVEAFNLHLSASNILDIAKNYDIIADGTDNFPARYLINDAAVLLGIPCIYGSIFQFEGQVSVFYAKEGPCYRCLSPSPPPPESATSCAESGVFAPLPGIIGTLQANEIIKLILGIGSPLLGRLLIFDALNAAFKEFKIEKDKNCPICGANPSIKQLIDYEDFCGYKQNKTKISEISPEELEAKIKNSAKLQIIDIREPSERAFFIFPQSKNIPLSQISRRMGELNSDFEIVLACQAGYKSVFAARILEENGFQGKVFNLTGGINKYIESIQKA